MDEKKVILERKWKVMETTEDFLHLATDWWNQFQNIEKVELCIKKVEGKVTAPYHSGLLVYLWKSLGDHNKAEYWSNLFLDRSSSEEKEGPLFWAYHFFVLGDIEKVQYYLRLSEETNVSSCDWYSTANLWRKAGGKKKVIENCLYQTEKLAQNYHDYRCLWRNWNAIGNKNKGLQCLMELEKNHVHRPYHLYVCIELWLEAENTKNAFLSLNSILNKFSGFEALSNNARGANLLNMVSEAKENIIEAEKRAENFNDWEDCATVWWDLEDLFQAKSCLDKAYARKSINFRPAKARDIWFQVNYFAETE